MVVFGKGVKFWGTDEKTKSNTINAFHPALKFYTLSFSFWFLRMPKRNYEWRIINLVVLKIGGIFKKQWKNFPSATAEAQSKGVIFLFVYWAFLIAFINSWCHEYCSGFIFSIIEEICLVTVWHRLLWKQLPLFVVANEKWYSCWLFWFCGCLIGVQTEEVIP